jgi:hypothetical protein
MRKRIILFLLGFLIHSAACEPCPLGRGKNVPPSVSILSKPRTWFDYAHHPELVEGLARGVEGLIIQLAGWGKLVNFGYCSAEGQESNGLVALSEKEKVDPNQWDFGIVKPGVVLKHDFLLKNETSDILEINNIHTSCGCTASEAKKKSLLPQESTLISVSFNSHGYLGPVEQFVYVNTDNADLAIIKFTIKANVVKN